MAMNDDELVAVVRTGDKSGTSFHGGGVLEREREREKWMNE